MSDNTLNIVKDKYGSVATSGLSSSNAGVRAVAEAFGYSAEELASIPAEANMGLSCGNPTAFANLREGETVVDLGCGGGLDVFLAAKKVGLTGKAIGIDMTERMIELAKKNAMHDTGEMPTNIEFHLATIDTMPLDDASVDCIVSNCVINLAPDKDAVFREINRVLKPGGRLAISDLALKQPLPEAIVQDVMAYVGCIAGALGIDEYQSKLTAAGFEHVQVQDMKSDINAYAEIENQSGCCSPSMATDVGATACCGGSEPTVHGSLMDLLRQYDINDYVASVRVYAVKP